MGTPYPAQNLTERVILSSTMTSEWGGTIVVSARVTGALKSTLEAPHGCSTSPEPQTTPDKCDHLPGGCEKWEKSHGDLGQSTKGGHCLLRPLMSARCWQ